jgi:hypothetical protein
MKNSMADARGPEGRWKKKIPVEGNITMELLSVQGIKPAAPACV